MAIPRATITAKQTRALRMMLRKYPDFVQPLLTEHGGVIQNLTVTQASEIIGKTYEKYPQNGDESRPEKSADRSSDNSEQEMPRTAYKPGTKEDFIARALLENGFDEGSTFDVLSPSLGVGALKFYRRLPSGDLEQIDDSDVLESLLRVKITNIKKALLAAGAGRAGVPYTPPEDGSGRASQRTREARDYLMWVRRLRAWCSKQAADGHPIDEIGLRPVEYGAKMINAGIPLEAIKHALTMHYPKEGRRALGVMREYDVQSFRREEQRDGIHAAMPYVMALAEQRIPIALVGPKGTGKTTMAKQLSEVLGLPFGMVSMTSGTSPSAFNGRPRIGNDGADSYIRTMAQQGHEEEAHRLAKSIYEDGDTVSSQFVKIYGSGGIFLFDEMDAADENLLLLVNAALANGVFANSATGEIIEQHPDFIPVAGMNTLGLGAGRSYSGRNRLDAATLDRWNAGRVRIELDPRIEEHIFWSIINDDAD